jgi:sialidase-1
VLSLAVALALQAASAEDVRRLDFLPPGPGNPRNSEGDFLPLRDGRLLFAYSKFSGGAADDAAAEIAGRYSSDGGLTWTERDVTLVGREGSLNVMSVTLLRMKDGRPGLFYLRREAKDDCRMYLRRSGDDGQSFGAPELCMPDVGYFVVNNDRVIRLKSGRLVVPAARHCLKGEAWNYRATAVAYLSDDDGATWRRSADLAPPSEGRSGLQEPLVVELKDGRVLLLSRTDLGFQYRSVSADGGETWSPAARSTLASPLSPASVARVPSTGDLLAAWNDHSRIAPSLKGKRTPFTVALSKDEGETWTTVRTIEDAPDGWYCYTAIEIVGTRVLLAHCAGDAKVGHLNRTRLTSFDLKWLYP